MKMRKIGSRGSGGRQARPVRFRSARNVLTVLEAQVEAVREDFEIGASEKARTIGYLAAIALRALEVSDLAARTEAVEALLTGRTRDEGEGAHTAV